MNPPTNETGLQLPAPIEASTPVQAPSSGPAGSETGLVGAAALGNTGNTAFPERLPAGPETVASPQMPAVGSAAPSAVPLPVPPQMQAGPLHTTGQAAASTTASPPADDGDLIEKEWVNKAKQIVESTRNDPYKQSEGLTGVKVEYIKKRYGKTIKLK